MRFTLYHNQRGYCHYCNVKMTTALKGPYHVTADHVRTKKEGGSDNISNMVGACFTCNNLRGAIRYEAFKQFTLLYGREHFVSVYKRLTAAEIEVNKAMWAFIRHERPDVAWIAPKGYFENAMTWKAPTTGTLKGPPPPPVKKTTAVYLPLRRPYLQVCRGILRDIKQKFTYDQRKAIIEGLLDEERQLRNSRQDRASRGLRIGSIGSGAYDEGQGVGPSSGNSNVDASDWPVFDTDWSLPSPSH